MPVQLGCICTLHHSLDVSTIINSSVRTFAFAFWMLWNSSSLHRSMGPGKHQCRQSTTEMPFTFPPGGCPTGRGARPAAVPRPPRCTGASASPMHLCPCLVGPQIPKKCYSICHIECLRSVHEALNVDEKKN